MFRRAQSNGLKLTIDENRYTFSSPEDFAFALAGRAGVPGSRVESLVEMSDEALHREAEAIRQVEQKFNAALDGSLHDVTSISPSLKESPMKKRNRLICLWERICSGAVKIQQFS